MTTKSRSRREIREDAALEIRDALRSGGELTARQLADRTGLGARLVDSVCRELEFCREITVRRDGRTRLWRLPGHEPDADVRPLLERCWSRGVRARRAEWQGMQRIGAPHPFAAGGRVWLDDDEDVDWYLTERGVAA